MQLTLQPPVWSNYSMELRDGIWWTRILRRVLATFKMEFFSTLVNGYKLLTFFKKNYVLDFEGVLDSSLIPMFMWHLLLSFLTSFLNLKLFLCRHNLNILFSMFWSGSCRVSSFSFKQRLNYLNYYVLPKLFLTEACSVFISIIPLAGACHFYRLQRWYLVSVST